MYTARKLKAFDDAAPLLNVYYTYENVKETNSLYILSSCHTSTTCLDFGNENASPASGLFILYEENLSSPSHPARRKHPAKPFLRPLTGCVTQAAGPQGP